MATSFTQPATTATPRIRTRGMSNGLQSVSCVAKVSSALGVGHSPCPGDLSIRSVPGLGKGLLHATRRASPRVTATAVPAGGSRREIWEVSTKAEEFPYGRLAAGVAALYGADRATAAALLAAGSTLPSAVVLLGVIGGLMAVGGRTAAEMYDWMHPAIAFFDQWMPLFFVPSISTIALAPLPRGMDLAKSVALLGLSYLSTLWATAALATAVRQLLKKWGISTKTSTTTEQLSDADKLSRIGDAAKMWAKRAAQHGAKSLASAALKSEDQDTQNLAAKGALMFDRLARNVPSPTRAPSLPTLPGYSLSLLYTLALLLLSPALMAGQTTLSPTSLAPGLLLLSIALFNSAKKLPSSIRSWLGPTLAGGAAMASVMAAFGIYRGATWQAGIRLYTAGAGALLGNLIGPAVAALGFKVYSQKALLQEHAADLVLVCTLMAPIQLLATAALGRALGAPPLVVSSLLPAHTTLGMALPLAPLLLASPGLIVAGVTIAGTTGISTARSLLDSWKIRDPTSRGLSMGIASHSLGTSALVADEPRSAAVSGLAFALKGSLTVLLLSMPSFRQAVVLLATGKVVG